MRKCVWRTNVAEIVEDVAEFYGQSSDLAGDWNGGSVALDLSGGADCCWCSSSTSLTEQKNEGGNCKELRF